MWLSDERNVENHVTLTDKYASNAAWRRKTGRLQVDKHRNLVGYGLKVEISL